MQLIFHATGGDPPNNILIPNHLCSIGSELDTSRWAGDALNQGGATIDATVVAHHDASHVRRYESLCGQQGLVDMVIEQIKFTPQRSRDCEEPDDTEGWCALNTAADEAVFEVHRKGQVECTDPGEWHASGGCYEWQLESLRVPLTMFLESKRAKNFLAKEVIIKVRRLGDMVCLGEAVLDVAHHISPSKLTKEVTLEMGEGTLEMVMHLDVLGAVRRHVHQILDKTTEYFQSEVQIPVLDDATIRSEILGEDFDHVDLLCHQLSR